MTQYYNDEKIHTRKSNTTISNSKFKIMMKFSKLQFFINFSNRFVSHKIQFDMGKSTV